MLGFEEEEAGAVKEGVGSGGRGGREKVVREKGLFRTHNC